MRVDQLREQLSDLKKKETIAQTREALLNEEKVKLLTEIDVVLKLVKELGVVPEDQLTPNNLPALILTIQQHIETELSKSSVPSELI